MTAIIITAWSKRTVFSKMTLCLILVIDIYFGIKVFSSLSFAFLVLATASLCLLSKQLPLTRLLVLTAGLFSGAYCLLFSPWEINWRYSLMAGTALIHLEAWICLCHHSGTEKRRSLWIHNMALVAGIVPFYLAQSGFTGSMRPIENIILTLSALILVFYLESTRTQVPCKAIQSKMTITERGIPLLVMLLILSLSFLLAQTFTNNLVNFIPGTVKYIKEKKSGRRDNKKAAKNGKDANTQKSDDKKNTVAYTKEQTLHSSINLHSDNNLDIILKVISTNHSLDSGSIYLHCNFMTHFENRTWRDDSDKYTVIRDQQDGEVDGWVHLNKKNAVTSNQCATPSPLKTRNWINCHTGVNCWP